MNTYINPSFSHFFSDPNPDWSTFSSTETDLVGPLKDKEVDFCVTTSKTRTPVTDPDVKWKLGSLIKKVLLIAKHYLFRFGMSLAYPPQSNILKILFPSQFSVEESDKTRLSILKNCRTQPLELLSIWKNILAENTEEKNVDDYTKKINDLEKSTWLVKHVVLEKDGIRYSGMLMGRENTIQNGKWILQGAPIGCTNEDFLYCFDLPKIYQETDFNIFMINNPNVGRSEGECTPQSIGEAQELGLRMLEKAIKAKKIALVGISFGGAALAQAVKQHEFNLEKHQYQVLSQMTFGKFSVTAERCLRIPFLGSICSWLGIELEAVEAAKKLETHQIKHIILQKTKHPILSASLADFVNDNPIAAEATLGYSLQKSQNQWNHTQFYGLGEVAHLGDEVFQVSNHFLHEFSKS